MDEKIIDKIRKCLALSLNNPSAAEAESAALTAQRLMAKHGITAIDVEDEMAQEDKIEIAVEEVGAGKAWKFQLATIIADNFRCKTFSYGKRSIAFYGYSTDAEAAKEVFRFLFKLGHKLAEREGHKRWRETGERSGVYNSYVLGFMTGIKSKLEEQCKALMIITPKEVEEEYSDFIKGAKSRNVSRLIKDSFDHNAYESGFTEGKHAMGRRELND
jgi:hypothetical protein